jgi:hypothetical protein
MFAASAAVPSVASAQSFGVGGRLSFVKSDVPDAPSTRFPGGFLRISSSKHIVLEGALDYRSTLSDDGHAQLRQAPFQASLLLFPVRKTLSPYLLGGIGIYSEFTDTLAADGSILETVQARKTGWHLGGGAELFFGRHAAFFADYRFLFVKFGQPDPDAEPIDLPGLDRLKLSHRGSMWTSGMTFYF